MSPSRGSEAARQAIDESGGDTLLVGRAENFFAGVPDLDDTLSRLKAYAAAGADCLYAPGIQTREQIEAVVAAVAPEPVNVLIGSHSDASRCRTWPRSACGASAWAARWRGRRGAASCEPRSRLPTDASTASPTPLRARNSTRCFARTPEAGQPYLPIIFKENIMARETI